MDSGMLKRTILAAVAAAAFYVHAGDELAPPAPHPRLFVGEGGFAAAKKRLESSVALARDWLDDALEEPDKNLLAEAILKKGLVEADGKTLRDGWWSKCHNNWNQVCNGGLAAGAAAVRENYPEIAEAVLRRARKNLPVAMKQYAGGNFPEGPGYWEYASDYTAIALDVLERQFAGGVPADSPNPGITRIRFRRTAGEDGCLGFSVEAVNAFGPMPKEVAP